MKYTTIRLMYVKEGVVRKEGVRQGVCARYVACWGGKKLVVVLWAGWIVKCSSKGVMVGDMDNDVWCNLG